MLARVLCGGEKPARSWRKINTGSLRGVFGGDGLWKTLYAGPTWLPRHLRAIELTRLAAVGLLPPPMARQSQQPQPSLTKAPIMLPGWSDRVTSVWPLEGVVEREVCLIGQATYLRKYSGPVVFY